MKKNIIIASISLCVIVFVWFFLFKDTTETQGGTATSQGTVGAIFTPITNQIGLTSTDVSKNVQSDFTHQIENANQIKLNNVAVVSTYALQNWEDSNKGGQALLRYSSSEGWKLVSMGGGVWDVSGLVRNGVPRSVAQQLVQEITK